MNLAIKHGPSRAETKHRLEFRWNPAPKSADKVANLVGWNQRTIAFTALQSANTVIQAPQRDTGFIGNLNRVDRVIAGQLLDHVLSDSS